MAVLRLFAAARDAAGTSKIEIEADTVGAVLEEARARFGTGFAAVLARSRVWLNGQPTDAGEPVSAGDVVAVLPPVSGGSAEPAAPPSPPSPASLAASASSEPSLGPEASVGPPARPPAPVGPPADPPMLRTSFAVRPEVHGPHGRLGIAWAVVTLGAAWAGRVWLGAWFGLVAFAAAAQLAGVWRRQGARPVWLVGAGGAAAVAVAGASGVAAVTAVVAATVLVALLVRVRIPSPTPTRDVALTVALALPIGLAAASPVLLRGRGVTPPLVLLGLAAAYDAGNYVVGTGATSAWEGAVAGVAALIPVTIGVAVFLVPPFRTSRGPFLLGALAAVTAPLGPLAASALLGDPAARAPALRRLDSLLVLGPLWSWSSVVLLRP